MLKSNRTTLGDAVVLTGAVATGRLSKRHLRTAPGRYRCRYCTNVAWFNLKLMRGSRGFPSSVRLFINLERSEIESRAELQLARIGRGGEAERIGRPTVRPAAQVEGGQRRRADDVIDALEVGMVEEIEAFDRELQVAALLDEEATGQAHVEAVEGFAAAGVSPGLSRTVAL